MKNIYLPLPLFFLLLIGTSCRHTSPVVAHRTQNKARIALTRGYFKEHALDSTRILYPQGIHYFNHHIILVEQKNDPVLSFWNADNLSYEFSAGSKGAGPNEVKYVYPDYFDKTDSTFFILDSGVEKEVRLSDQSISIIRRTPILVPDAVNRLVRIDSGQYVMCGLNGGSKEHILYKIDGQYEEFGDYPDLPCLPEKRFILFYKFIAYTPGKPFIYDFYLYLNLIRKYDLKGNLLEEISLADIPGRDNTMDKLRAGQIEPYFSNVISRKDFIVVLYYENATNRQVYDGQAIPELQLWNWEGELIRRYRFDRCFDQYTLSDDGMLYAKDTETPYAIYTYDLQLAPAD